VPVDLFEDATQAARVRDRDRTAEQPAAAARAARRAPIVLFPSDQAFPRRGIVRKARIVIESDEIVLVGFGGGGNSGGDNGEGDVRRIPIGPGGVIAAVYVSVPGELPHRYAKRRPPYELVAGAVDLLDADGSVLLTVPVADWCPGAADEPAVAGTAAFHQAALSRSGLGSALRAMGLEVYTVDRIDDPLFGDRVNAPVPVPSAGLRAGTPKTLGQVSGLVFLVGLVTLAGITPVATPSALPLLLALGGLLSCVVPLCMLAYVTGLLRQDTASDVVASTVLRPCPSSAVTRRFLDEAIIRVVNRTLVFVDGVGTERWVPLGRPYGVTGCVFVKGTPVQQNQTKDQCPAQAAETEPQAQVAPAPPPAFIPASAQDPVAVRFVDADGVARATLPWPDWFGGPGGASALRNFALRIGLEVSEQTMPLARERRSGLPVLPGVRVYRSLSYREVVGRLRRRPALPRISDFFPSLALGPVVVVLAVYTPVSVGTVIAGVLGSMALAGSLAPFVGAWAWRWLWWDRPLPHPPAESAAPAAAPAPR
jgi:hypothetical protein